MGRMNTDPRRAALFSWFDGTAVDARLLAGLLGYLDAIDPLRQPGVIAVDTNDEATELAARALEVHQMEWIGPEEGWDCGCNEYGTLGPWLTFIESRRHQARAVLAALARQGEQP